MRPALEAARRTRRAATGRRPLLTALVVGAVVAALASAPSPAGGGPRLPSDSSGAADHMQYLLSTQPGAAVDPDNAASTGAIYLVDAVTGTPQRIGRGFGAVLSPDGKQLAYEQYRRNTDDPGNPDFELVVSALDGSNAQDVAAVPATDHYSWGADSAALYFSAADDSGVSRFDVAGKDVSTASVNDVTQPVVDPSDNSLWISFNEHVGRVYGRDGTQPSILIGRGDVPDWATFSSNGRLISWVTQRAGESGRYLHTLDLDTAQVTDTAPVGGETPFTSPVLQQVDSSGQRYDSYPVATADGLGIRTLVTDAGGTVESTGSAPTLIANGALGPAETTTLPSFLGGEVGGYTPPALAQDDAFALPAAPGTASYDVIANDFGTVAAASLTLQPGTDPGIVATSDGKLQVVDDGTAVALTAHYRVCSSATAAAGSPSCSTATATFSRPAQPTNGQLQESIDTTPGGRSGGVAALAGHDITVYPDFLANGPYSSPATVQVLIPAGATFRSITPLAGNGFEPCSAPAAGTVVSGSGPTITCRARGLVPQAAIWALTVTMPDRRGSNAFGIGGDPNANRYGLNVQLTRPGLPTLTLSPPDPPQAGVTQTLTATVGNVPDGYDFAAQFRPSLVINGRRISLIPATASGPGKFAFDFTPTADVDDYHLVATLIDLSPYLYEESAAQDVSIPKPHAPDIVTALAHTGDFVQGATGQLVVNAHNAGDAEGTLSHLTVHLPPGLTYASTEALDDGNQFTCTADGDRTTVDCNPNGQTLAAGADLPRIGIDVAIADDASGGDATAHLSSDGDADEDNDTATDDVEVTGAPTTGPDSGLVVRFGSTEPVVAGKRTSFTASITNKSDDTVTGPISLHVALNAQVSFGLPIRILGGVRRSGGSPTTQCTVQTSGFVQQNQVLSCNSPGGLSAGAALIIGVNLDIPAGDIGATQLLSYEARAGSASQVMGAGSYKLRVLPPLRAALQAAITGPPSISTFAQPFDVDVSNSGTGSTSEQTVVTFPGSAKLVITPDDGTTGWTCTNADALTLQCRYAKAILAAGHAAKLTVDVAAPSGFEPQTLEADVSSADDTGPATGKGVVALTVTKPVPSVLAVTRSNVTGASYDLAVANGGAGPSHGTVTVTERVPEGVQVTATSADLTWGCTQQRTRLICVADHLVIAAGKSGPPVHVTLSGAAGDGTFSLNGFAQDYFGPGLNNAGSIKLSSGTPGPPTVSTSAHTAHSPLVRGARDTTTLEMHSVATAAASSADLPVIGLVLPPGMRLAGDLPASSAPQQAPAPGTAGAMTPVSGAGPTLHCRADATARAVVCLADSVPAATTVTDQDVPVAVSDAAAGDQHIVTGLVPVTGATADARLASALQAVQSNGVSALGQQSDADVPLVALTAAAGNAQRLTTTTPSPDGKTTTPTVVKLDGSASIVGGSPVTYGWVQTMGPAVSWQASAAGDAPSSGGRPAFATGALPDGRTAPDAYGTRPAFTVPTLPATTTFGFRLYLTDGTLVSTAETTVVMAPTADRPPVIASVNAYDLTAHSDCATACTTPLGDSAPEAGHRVLVRAAVTDADGDAVATTVTVLKPTEVGITFEPSAGRPGDHVFTWPADTPQLTLSVAATDNHVDGNGKPVIAGSTVKIGPDPTPLGIAINAPAKTAVPGVPIPLTAALTNGSALDTDVTWKQVSGPGGTFSAQHLPGTTFTLADGAKLGDSVVVEADAVRGSGSDAASANATVTISVIAVPAPVAYVDDVKSLHADQNGTTKLTAHGLGGVGDLTYTWKVTSGGGTLDDADTATPTYHAPGDPGLTRLTLTVTDSRGASTSEPVPVLVGTVPDVDPSNVTPCDVHHVLGRIYQLVAHGQKALTLGPITLDIGSLTTPDDTCDPNVTLTVDDASFRLGPLTFTGVNATVDKDDIKISSATVSVPATWKLGSAVAKDVDIDLSTFDISGDVQWVHDPLPFLSTPDSVSAAGTTITLGADALILDTTAKIAGGTVTMHASVGTRATDDAQVKVALQDIVVFGVHIDGHGTLDVKGDDVTGDVEIDLGSHTRIGLTVATSSLIWTPKQFEYKASATVLGGRMAILLDGTFSDDDDYALSVSADANNPNDFSPTTGLNIDKNAGVSGSFTSVKGVETESIEVDAHGAIWHAGPATIDHLQVKITNRDAPPYCPARPAGQPDIVTVDGLASLKIGSSTQSFAVRACVIDPSGDWRLDTTSAASAINAAGDVTLADVSLTAAQTGDKDPDFVLSGSLSTHGIKAKATLALLGDNPAGGGDDFLVDAQLDLSDLGLPSDLGPGDLLYTTVDVPDLSTIPGLDLAIPKIGDVDPLVDYAIDQGYTALTSFDVPRALGDFLDNTIHLPTTPQVLVSATLGDEVEIKASLNAPDGGLELFKTDSGTRLALERISLEFSTGGSFGLDADAELTIPKPDAASGDDVATVKLSAGISIELVGVPSITVTLEKTGDVWHDAFGVGGLDLGDIAIQGGIVFSTPPTPQIGFGATITSLPESWRKPLGIVGNEPITFVVNISVKNPIFALTLGTADGTPFLEPLAPISPSLGSALAIDDASLVIAPLGGDVGPFHFEPGLHLRFDALVFGVSLNVAADFVPTTGELKAAVKIGSFGFAGVTLHETTFTLDVTKDGGEMTFDGGIDLPGKAGVTASVDAKFDPSGISFTFKADAQNIGLGSVLSLDELHIVASGKISDLAPPSLDLAAYGTVHILGTQMKFGGDLVLGAPFGITAFHVYAGADPFHVGPVLVSGSGCGQITLPAGVPTPPTDGLCVTAGFDPTSSTPLTLGLHGSVSVAGVGVTFDGSLDNTGVALSATIKVASAAAVAVNGRLYFGSGLAGVTAPDGTGKQQQVHAGDFAVSGTGRVSLLGFGAEFSVTAGHIGSSEFVHGAAKFDLLGSGIALQGDFSHDDSGFHWALQGTGHITVAGYNLLSVSASASSGSDGSVGKLSINGTLSLGPLSAKVSGFYDDTAGGDARFQIAGTGELNVLGVTVSAQVSVGNVVTKANPHGDLAASAVVDGKVGGLVTLHGSVEFDTGGHLCVAGSASVVGGLATGTVTFCTPGTLNPGLHATFSVLGLTVKGDLTPTDWSFTAELGPFSGSASCDLAVISARIDFYFDLKIGISSKDGVSFAGKGSIDAYGCVNYLVGSDCAHLFGVELSVDNAGYDDDSGHHAEVSACARTSLLDVDVKACWGSERGFQWIDP